MTYDFLLPSHPGILRSSFIALKASCNTVAVETPLWCCQQPTSKASEALGLDWKSLVRFCVSTVRTTVVIQISKVMVFLSIPEYSHLPPVHSLHLELLGGAFTTESRHLSIPRDFIRSSTAGSSVAKKKDTSWLYVMEGMSIDLHTYGQTPWQIFAIQMFCITIGQ